MPIFQYSGIDKKGANVSGEVSASNVNEARKNLIIQGVQPTGLNEASSTKAKTEAVEEETSKFESGDLQMNFSETLSFIEQFSDLIGAGVNIDESLQSVAASDGSPKISAVARSVHTSVTDGNSLSQSLSTVSKSFDSVFCSLVAAGEESGSVANVLRRQVLYMSRMKEIRSRLVNTMIYPAFLIFAGIGVSILFVFFLLPKLNTLIQAMGGASPWLIRFLLGAKEFTEANWPIVTGALVLLLFFLVIISRTAGFQIALQETYLKTPLVGRLVRSKIQLQYFETLGNLISNGIPLSRSIEIAKTAVEIPSLKVKVDEIGEKVKDGASLSHALGESGLFDRTSIDMIRIGERTGKMTTMIEKCAEKLDRQFAVALERLTSLMQPVIILIMAIGVGSGAYLMLKMIYSAMQIMQTR